MRVACLTQSHVVKTDEDTCMLRFILEVNQARDRLRRHHIVTYTSEARNHQPNTLALAFFFGLLEKDRQSLT